MSGRRPCATVVPAGEFLLKCSVRLFGLGTPVLLLESWNMNWFHLDQCVRPVGVDIFSLGPT